MFIPHDPVSSASLKNLVLLQSDDQQSDISSVIFTELISVKNGTEHNFQDRVRGPARRLPSKSGHECNKSFSDADAPLSTVDSISSKVVDLYPTNSNATSIPNPQQRKSQSFQPSHNSVKRPSPAERKGIFSAVDSPPSDAFFAKSTAAGIASSNRQNPLQSTDKKNDVPKADESKPSASKPKFKANKSIFESSSSSEDEFILPPLIPSKKSSPTFLTSKTVAKTPTTKTAPPVVKPTPAAVPAASTNKCFFVFGSG
jgi:hypothetical protein